MGQNPKFLSSGQLYRCPPSTMTGNQKNFNSKRVVAVIYVSTYSTALGSLSCREALTIIVVRAPAMCLSQDRCPKLRCALMSLLDQTSKEAFPTLSNSSPNRSPRRPWFTGRDYVRKMTIMFTHPTSKRKSQCHIRN